MLYRILCLFVITLTLWACNHDNNTAATTSFGSVSDGVAFKKNQFSCEHDGANLTDGVNVCAANSLCFADTGCSIVQAKKYADNGLEIKKYALEVDTSVGPQQACRGPFLPLGATHSREDDSVTYTNELGETVVYNDRFRSLAVEGPDGSCSARVVADPCPEGTVVSNTGPSPTIAICVPVVACDDMNPCPETADQCTENQCLNGECIEVSRVNLGCDDGDACTQNDVCDAFNACVGEALVCAGQLACANEVCQDGACVLTEQQEVGALCEDGDPCTIRSECTAESVCVAVENLSCDDHQVCTDDACDPTILDGSPCVNTARPDDSVCSDESLCTEDDVCLSGVCTGSDVVCADPGPCQVGSCDPALGCVTSLLANGLACPDGVCIDGACTAQNVVCDENNTAFCDTIDGNYGFYRCNIAEGETLGAAELVESCGAGALCIADTDPHCTEPQACVNDNDCGPLEACVNTVCVQGDSDGDGTIDALDNCPADANIGQEDRDGDGVGDGCDNCPDDANPGQVDTNDDGQGDVCEVVVPDEICDNGADDDGDMLTDCADTDCLGVGVCPDETGNVVGGELLCSNTVDDDGDGFADCLDPDCSDAANCQPLPEVCDDMVDNDSDGAIDCDDPDCADAANCVNDEMVYFQDIAPIFTNNCVGCHHGGGNPSAGLSLVDAAAVREGVIGVGSAQGMNLITAGDSSQSYIWHKVNGTVGIINGSQMPPGANLSPEDIATLATWIDGGALFAPETCDDGVDDDGDGAVDCADLDCADSPTCAPAGGDPACVDNSGCAEGEVCVANTCRSANGACTTFAVEVTVAENQEALLQWWTAGGNLRAESVASGTYQSQNECSVTVFDHDTCTCHISDGVSYPCTFLSGDAGPVGCIWNGDNNN